MPDRGAWGCEVLKLPEFYKISTRGLCETWQKGEFYGPFGHIRVKFSLQAAKGGGRGILLAIWDGWAHIKFAPGSWFERPRRGNFICRIKDSTRSTSQQTGVGRSDEGDFSNANCWLFYANFDPELPLGGALRGGFACIYTSLLLVGRS